MQEVPEQVVSKIREITEGLPSVQKRLLARAKAQGADWLTLERVPAVYCVFSDSGDCIYVGQSGDVFRRVTTPTHPTNGKGAVTVYVPLVQVK